VSEDYATRARERHPIQNLLDDVDAFHGTIAGPDGQLERVPLDGEFKAHVKDMLMSAYATGACRNG
jgi:hypothetical protein